MNKSSHAFGSIKNLATAIEAGKINARDIVFFDEGKIGWLDKEGKLVTLEDDTKFEIVSAPVGTLINYGEDEIRVMCPADTEWKKQNVGSTGNANMYYMGFRAYAPKDAVGFKEGMNAIEDEMFDFSGDFAGTDEYGRNYSIVWLALASYDEASDSWSYFGAQSSTERYIGWNYMVEWYNADGIVISTDNIRINLSNESCHNTSEPYYVGNMVAKANAYTDEKVAEAAVMVVEF